MQNTQQQYATPSAPKHKDKRAIVNANKRIHRSACKRSNFNFCPSLNCFKPSIH